MSILTSLTINGKDIEADEGLTVLEVAKKFNFPVYSLCETKGTCKDCGLSMISVKGEQGYSMACKTKIKNNMEIELDTSDLKIAIKNQLEKKMLNSDFDYYSCGGTCHFSDLYYSKKFHTL